VHGGVDLQPPDGGPDVILIGGERDRRRETVFDRRHREPVAGEIALEIRTSRPRAAGPPPTMQRHDHGYRPANRLGGQIQVEEELDAIARCEGQRAHLTYPRILDGAYCCTNEPGCEHVRGHACDGRQMKSSGRGLSARARRSSGVISRLIGTPQIACACASNAARSESAAACLIHTGS
jgi:hypothetical protein